MPLRRDPERPLLRPTDVPALRPDLVDVSSVFNPGAALWRGREVLALRVQTRGRTTVLLAAERQRDGRVVFADEVVRIAGLEEVRPAPAHVYDPRLTVIEGELFAVCACDFDDGCRLLTARVHALTEWELVDLDREGDRRNGVLFPERIDGSYLRLQRPNRALRSDGPPTGDAITLAASPDLRTWQDRGEVMRGRPRSWDELIGSGPPPVKTREGWLHVYHGVATHFASVNVYQAGVALLDLSDPARVRARGAFNVLEPRMEHELVGQVPNVVFPSGMIVEHSDSEGYASLDSAVRIYYGAADTVVGVARSTVRELIDDARFAG